MLQYSARRFGFMLLIGLLSACQTTPTTQLNATSIPPTIRSQVVDATLTPTTVSHDPNALPELMQLPASSIHQINPNNYGLLADPASLPARSDRVIDENSLAQIELLQTIGLGYLQSADFAPNNRFLVVVTSLGFGVYELPTLQQRYFVRTENPINTIRVSPDNANIEALIEFSNDPGLANTWSIERYAATTGALIERLPTDDTNHLWNTQPTNYDQPHPRMSSPDGKIEARFAVPKAKPSDSHVKLWRIDSQELIFNGSAQYLRFSADSSQALLIDQQVLRLVNLSDGQSQSLSFPSYGQLTFSPDGQLLALGNGQELLDLSQTRSISSLASQAYKTSLPIRPDFSSDSQQINLGVSQWNLSMMQALWLRNPSSMKGDVKNFIVTDADYELVVEVMNAGLVSLSISQAGESVYYGQLESAQLVDIVVLAGKEELLGVTAQGQVSSISMKSGVINDTIHLNQTALGLAVSPDQQWIAVATQPQTNNGVCAVVLNYTTFAVSQTITCERHELSFEQASWYPAIQFSPDSELLLVQSAALAKHSTEPNLTIYRVRDGQALFAANNAIIAPNQRLIATIERGQLQLWGLKP